MSLTCTNKFIDVYFIDAVVSGNKTSCLYAVYASKFDKEAGFPPMYEDVCPFIFDPSSPNSIKVQAENAIKVLNGNGSCVNS